MRRHWVYYRYRYGCSGGSGNSKVRRDSIAKAGQASSQCRYEEAEEKRCKTQAYLPAKEREKTAEEMPRTSFFWQHEDSKSSHGLQSNIMQNHVEINIEENIQSWVIQCLEC